MAQLVDALSEAERQLLRKRAQPSWMSPMLATLTHKYFSDPVWIFERKLDGVRCLAYCQKKTVRLFSRNRKDLNATYPELVDALREHVDGDRVLDGEIVAFRGKLTSFERLQKRMQLRDPEAARQSGVPVYFYLFDLLYADGYETTQLALRTRKRLLKHALCFRDPLRYTTHRNEEGEAYYEDACRKGWEGIIAKKADSRYVHFRSRDWLKFKCANRQEFVIGGYTDPRGSRTGFGALLVGYYERGELVFAGKVGTGFDRELLQQLSRQLKSLERKTPPFGSAKGLPRRAHWVEPELVAEITFTEWTRDGKLRHPRFVGLRTDKNPEDVVRERAV